VFKKVLTIGLKFILDPTKVSMTQTPSQDKMLNTKFMIDRRPGAPVLRRGIITNHSPSSRGLAWVGHV
jgi:hypothetical protein